MKRRQALLSVRGVVRAAVVAVAVCVSLVSAASAAVNIETVTVGNPGNAADTRYALSGYGSVGYAYNIGKYEVTAGQYTAFLNAVAKVPIYRYELYNTNMARSDYGSRITRIGGGTEDDPYTYSVGSDFANRPVNYVSFWDACRFTNWLHNGQPTGAQGPGTTERGAYTLDGYDGDDGRTIQRSADAKWAVTSEDEWYKAAYYKGGGTNAGYWDYPTSSNAAPGQDMADVSGNNANYHMQFGDYPIDSDIYTTVAGEFQNSDSPCGTFDQGGNVWEWNETVYLSSSWWCRGLRGGAFSSDGFGGATSLRADDLYYNRPTVENSSFGFRVSEVPEPATLSLLALGGLVALRRRR